MSELKACPCGKVPDELCVIEGETCRWRKVSGDCCGVWEIEFRVYSNDTKEINQDALAAWNAAPRAANGKKA